MDLVVYSKEENNENENEGKTGIEDFDTNVESVPVCQTSWALPNTKMVKGLV